MAYYCICHIPQKTRFQDVEEYLCYLGYKRIIKGNFEFFEEKDYLSTSGIAITINQNPDKSIDVHLSSQIFASQTDIDKFNFTVRQIRKRFSGYFESDFGKNRYIAKRGSDRKKAEAGCYLAYGIFKGNLIAVYTYRNSVKIDAKFPPPGMFPSIDTINPVIVSNNILVPFLVSIVEDYFKSSYVALLKYSDKKEMVIKNARLPSDDLIKIDAGEISIEEAIARQKSFQNIDRISSSFKEIDSGLDITGVLKQPFRRRKESLYVSIDKFFEQRHNLIHRHIILPDYSNEKLDRDIKNIEVSIKRIYTCFVERYNWDPGIVIPLRK